MWITYRQAASEGRLWNGLDIPEERAYVDAQVCGQ